MFNSNQIPAAPLDKKDLLQAGLIILRKLDKEEISYLYRVGTQGNVGQ